MTFRKECKEGKIATPQRRGFCFGHSAKRHNKPKCWKFHSKLKPVGSKGAKASRSEKEKETKATTGKNKSWKAKYT